MTGNAPFKQQDTVLANSWKGHLLCLAAHTTSPLGDWWLRSLTAYFGLVLWKLRGGVMFEELPRLERLHSITSLLVQWYADAWYSYACCVWFLDALVKTSIFCM